MCVWMFCPCACVCTLSVPGACKSQKRALDPLELELQITYEPSCGCWKPNPGILQEKQELLTDEPSTQLLIALEVEFHVAQAGLKISDAPAQPPKCWPSTCAPLRPA